MPPLPPARTATDPPQDRWRMVFDEAHRLCHGATSALSDRVEQGVRLLSSEGVGLYFCTQTPLGVPSGVLGHHPRSRVVPPGSAVGAIGGPQGKSTVRGGMGGILGYAWRC